MDKATKVLAKLLVNFVMGFAYQLTSITVLGVTTILGVIGNWGMAFKFLAAICVLGGLNGLRGLVRRFFR